MQINTTQYIVLKITYFHFLLSYFQFEGKLKLELHVINIKICGVLSGVPAWLFYGNIHVWGKYEQCTHRLIIWAFRIVNSNVLKNDSQTKEMKLDELIKQNPKLHDIFI